MTLDPPFRAASAADARVIAELVDMASEGVAAIEWQADARQQGGVDMLDVGARLYAGDQGNYCYRNCVVAEQDGAVMGMLLSFAEGPAEGEPAPPPPYDGSDVFAPFRYLEAPDTWYICGVALFPDYRGRGLGTQFLDIARRQAREHGFERLSLVVFEENIGALRLYQRLGFEETKRAPIIPHPLIRATGDALLMVAPLASPPTA